MKAYTDLEQSKKLAEILPLESADFMWEYDPDKETYWNKPTMIPIDSYIFVNDIPCWSLAALISIIPQEIFDGEYILNITEGCDNKWVITYDHYENRHHSYYGLSSGADNLIDACTDIIIKLKERNII